MSRATRVQRTPLATLVGLVAGVGAVCGSPLHAAAPPDEPLALGRELFARAWVPGDTRSRAGDGLGPVYNERSCLGCHHQGGAGGSAGADKNIEIITATGVGDGFPATGAFYSFGMSFGAAGFQYRISSGPGTTP